MTARLVLALVLVSACGHAPPRHRPPPVQLEVLLDEPIAQASKLGTLVDSFDLSPQRLVLLADERGMYLLGWGGMVTVEGAPAGIDTFAYTPDGLLLLVEGTQLSYLDEAGALAPLIELPNAGMGLAPGPAGVMYVFNRAPGHGQFGLYQLTEGGELTLLLESPEPIDAVAQAGERVFLATGGAAFEVTPGTSMHLVASLAASSMIRSIAADATTGAIFLSDGAAIYALADDRVEVVTREAGGTLRVRDGALMVLDVAHRMFLRLTPLAR